MTEKRSESPCDVRSIDEESIAYAASLIRRGELVVIPTDTVYGIAADPANPEAIARIFSAKRRPAEKSVQVLLSSLDEMPRYGLSLPAPLDELAKRFCPGGFSPICAAKPDCPFVTVHAVENGRGSHTQGVRIPDSDDTQRILAATGPLAASSANLSGEASPQTVDDAIRAFGNAVALYLDGGPTPGPVSSTVVASDPASEYGIALIREGAIPFAKIKEMLLESA